MYLKLYEIKFLNWITLHGSFSGKCLLNISNAIFNSLPRNA